MWVFGISRGKCWLISGNTGWTRKVKWNQAGKVGVYSSWIHMWQKEIPVGRDSAMCFLISGTGLLDWGLDFKVTMKLKWIAILIWFFTEFIRAHIFIIYVLKNKLYVFRCILCISDQSCLIPRVLFDVFITGISLNPEQWNQLKEQISEIDDAVKNI